MSLPASAGFSHGFSIFQNKPNKNRFSAISEFFYSTSASEKQDILTFPLLEGSQRYKSSLTSHCNVNIDYYDVKSLISFLFTSFFTRE